MWDDVYEAYESWCKDQGLDPELDYWYEYDEAIAEAKAEAWLDARR